MMQFVLHVTCSCNSYAYVLSFQYIWYIWCCLGLFWLSFLSLPLFLFTLVVSMAPKCNPLQPGTLFVPVLLCLLILYLLMFGSVMMMPLRHFQKTSLDEAFIQNAKSFCQTLLTPTFPLSFTIGDGSHCVTSRSLVLSCLSRSFTPTCMGLIIQYSLLHSRSRYAHSYHTATCCGYASSP